MKRWLEDLWFHWYLFLFLFFSSYGYFWRLCRYPEKLEEGTPEEKAFRPDGDSMKEEKIVFNSITSGLHEYNDLKKNLS